MVSGTEALREREERKDKPPVILVAVDDTPQAMWASQEGARLAASLRASVVLVHVIDPVPVMREEYAWIPADLGRIRQDYAERLLRHAADMMPVSIPCRTMLRYGVPESMIVVAANELHAAYIVLGTHGRGRMTHLLLGSVASAVARAAPCPVLVVAHAPSQATGPESAPTAAYDGPKVEVVRCRD